MIVVNGFVVFHPQNINLHFSLKKILARPLNDWPGWALTFLVFVASFGIGVCISVQFVPALGIRILRVLVGPFVVVVVVISGALSSLQLLGHEGIIIALGRHQFLVSPNLLDLAVLQGHDFIRGPGNL